MGINISEEVFASTFKVNPQNRGNRFVRNVSIYGRSLLHVS